MTSTNDERLEHWEWREERKVELDVDEAWTPASDELPIPDELPNPSELYVSLGVTYTEGLGRPCSGAAGLRRELSVRGLAHAYALAGRQHEITGSSSPSVIFRAVEEPDLEMQSAAARRSAGGVERVSHGNFVDASYRRILAHPNWRRRLDKVHTAKRQAGFSSGGAGEGRVAKERQGCWRELDCATSSDALLMNIFCYPGAVRSMSGLLAVQPDAMPEFGVKIGVPLTSSLPGANGKTRAARLDRTEVDMRLGTLLVEAKLTENDFQFAPMRLVERYRAFASVFDASRLHLGERGLRSYQLVRGVLAAYAYETRFCVMLDGRRSDLIEAWLEVLSAVRPSQVDLRARLSLVTWQEIAGFLSAPLQQFLSSKYGIFP